LEPEGWHLGVGGRSRSEHAEVLTADAQNRTRIPNYRRKKTEAPVAQVKITIRPNGPFRVEAPEGTIEMVDADGNKHDLTGKPAFSLCRCGGSANKPFCDGTHKQIFQRVETTVPPAEQKKPAP
jgi:CDGSH-type Zn-finger protein